LAITYIHTADWQLGKSFGSIEGDTADLRDKETAAERDVNDAR
jgi:hypothetical protein